MGNDAISIIQAMLETRRNRLQNANIADQRAQLQKARDDFQGVQGTYETAVDAAAKAQEKYATDKQTELTRYNTALGAYQTQEGQRATWEGGPGEYKTLQDEYNATYGSWNPAIRPTMTDFLHQKFGAWGGQVPEQVAASQAGTWKTGKYAPGTNPTLNLPTDPGFNVGDAPSFTFQPTTSVYGQSLDRLNSLARYSNAIGGGSYR
jgi:hypothetical protein